MKPQKLKTGREYRDTIRILYKEEKYYEGYLKALEFKSAIQNNDIEYTNNDVWACILALSIGSKRLNKFHMATYYAKLSLKYASNTYEFFKSKTMLAICYKYINKVNEAIEIYDNCIDMCDRCFNSL